MLLSVADINSLTDICRKSMSRSIAFPSFFSRYLFLFIMLPFFPFASLRLSC